MASWFVTQSGAGSANGTSLANAWSIANFNASNNPVAGDTVFFSGTLTGSVTPKVSGNSSAVLTLDFTGATFSGTGNIMANVSVSYVVFNGGTFASNCTSTALITIGAAATLDHCTVQGMTYVGPASTGDNPLGIRFGSTSGLGDVTFFTVQNCHFENSSDCVQGSDVQSHDITILNNYFKTNPNTNSETDVIQISDVYNVIIQGNSIINNAPGSATNGRHDDCIQTFRNGSSGSSPGTPHDWTIRYNYFWISETGGDGNNSAGMMEMMGNNIFIYGNVWYIPGNDPGNGLTFDSNVAGNTYFYNNTLWGNPANLCRFIASTGSTLFARNNICFGNPNATCVQWDYVVGATWDYNYLSSGSIKSATSGNPAGTHGSGNNPQLNNPTNGDMSLKTTSPCRNAGDTSIGATYNMGIAYGATWPNPQLAQRSVGNWDIGAYQVGGTGGSSTSGVGTASAISPASRVTRRTSVRIG